MKHAHVPVKPGFNGAAAPVGLQAEHRCPRPRRRSDLARQLSTRQGGHRSSRLASRRPAHEHPAHRTSTEAANQRGRSLTAKYAVRRLSASLSPRGAHRARSALSASMLESGAAARAARETVGVLPRNGEAPSDRSLGLLSTNPRPWLATRENGSAWGAACEPLSGAFCGTRRRKSRCPAKSERLRFREVEGANKGTTLYVRAVRSRVRDQARLDGARGPLCASSEQGAGLLAPGPRSAT